MGSILILVGCGGLDLELATHSAPGFEPVIWFQGQHTGFLLVEDRNGNVRISGNIKRDCGPQSDSQSGVCQDEFELWDFPRNHPFQPTRKFTANTHWKYHHPTDERALFDYEDQRGKMQLDLRGRAFYGKAQRKIPASSSDSLSCHIRLERLPGERMFHREECFALGLARGQVRIHWQKVSN